MLTMTNDRLKHCKSGNWLTLRRSDPTRCQRLHVYSSWQKTDLSRFVTPRLTHTHTHASLKTKLAEKSHVLGDAGLVHAVVQTLCYPSLCAYHVAVEGLVDQDFRGVEDGGGEMAGAEEDDGPVLVGGLLEGLHR